MTRSRDITLEGSIERVTFHNPDNHFTIARLDAGGQAGQITILGHLPAPRAGERVRLTGQWEKHPRYGQQFRFSTCRVVMPEDLAGLEGMLASGSVKGIGPKLARRLVEHFGEDLMQVLESDPRALTEVKGIGPQTAARIARGWQHRREMRRLSEFLTNIGVSPVHGARIFTLYGENWEKVLQKDPYRLADDWPKAGFLIADAAARHMENPVDEGRRAAACICHLLEQAAQSGHTYLARDDLFAACDARFNLDFHTVKASLEQLEQDLRLVQDTVDGGAAVYPAHLHRAECELGRRLTAKMSLPPEIPPAATGLRELLGRRLAISLSDEQLEALEGALHLPVAIITGGPGTGKTTLVRSLTVVLENLGRKVLLAAPTGRAARRLAGAAGRPAATIHKMLGYNLNSGSFERGPDDPLDCEAVIVDEASMVDLILMHNLVRAMPAGAQLILVGDVFQLPAIGPGNILADLMASGLVRAFELKTVFRQAAESTIIVNAHRVRTGRMPELVPWRPDRCDDFCFIEKHDPEEVVRCVVDLCTNTGWTRDLEINPRHNIQVLVPMHRGKVGTINLNQVLQQALNPGRQNPGGLPFRPGDKVMQLVNDYSREVFNGDIGQVLEIDPQDQVVRVLYGQRKVDYGFAEIDSLSLAYAISVHKAQGSEYPVVILPLLTQHYVLLQRNLLYTAITRAKQKVIIVGSAKAVRVAVRNNQDHRRLSGLAWRISENLATGKSGV